MTASNLGFRLAILMLIGGIGWGIAMAASGNHATMPAHAHLNLLGWVSLFLFGVFYRLHPSLERSRLALFQVVAWAVGTVVLAGAVGLIHSGVAEAEPVAAIGSLLMLADVLLFAFLAFRATQPGTDVLRRAAMTAAE